MINKDNLDEMLEYAIVEQGAKAHLQEFERKRNMARTFYLRFTSYAAAASVVLAACTTGALSYDAYKVGTNYVPEGGTKGASEIEALMENKDNKNALLKIEEAKKRISEEIEDPMFDDPEYIEDLNRQAEELEFLKGVCQLRRGRFFSARKTLKAIAADNGSYAEKAQYLIKKL